MVQNFAKLNVYQEAYDLSKDVYNEMKDVNGNFRLKEQLFGSTTAMTTTSAQTSSATTPQRRAR